MARPILHRYRDPLDQIWLTTAGRLGLRIVRSDAAYASTDGRGTLTIGTPASLDPDDCLAQIVFHELCHGLVQGEASSRLEDWGLDNTTDDDLPRERACLRVQAALSGRYGLRDFLAPTTEHRPFYDGLPSDPLAGNPGDPSVALAREGLGRADRAPWRGPLAAALEATATVVATASAFSRAGDLLHQAPSVRAGQHPLGFRLGPLTQTCSTCAWLHPWRDRWRCRVAGRAISPDAPACEAWEGTVDCADCGACCREAYGEVELGPRDPLIRLHPGLVQLNGDRWIVRRSGTRCAALKGESGSYRCSIYEDRPRNCRAFELAGRHCLEARRRVGLSPKP